MTDHHSADGEIWLTCRRLWPSDRQAVEAFFLRLDPETRANRFLASVGDRFALAYAERSFLSDGLMFGVFADGTLRGLGELRPSGRRACPGLIGVALGEQAEAAFAVERAFRRMGIGALLFRRLAEAARSRGVAVLQLRCLKDNVPMRRLAARRGAALRRVGMGTEGALRLRQPTPCSFWREAVAEACDLSVAIAAAPAEAHAFRAA